ncbi:MDR/zinc-dependent alcohol dehydrogenase-like family protein [Lentibacillus salicampi]|nr:alcohol dehydrogenase catalytic domain-containing protein [Lentibacillus salicampi]
MSQTEVAKQGQGKEIPETMHAIVAYAPEDYRFEEVKTPELENDQEMIIQLEGCGICAGDLKAYGGAPSFWGDEKQPPYIKAPMIPGHEFIGRIVQKGDAVKDFEIGDRVISEQIVPCENCRFCNRGEYWMCERHDLYGFQNNVNGGMAEYMKFTKEGINYKVPEELPLEKAVLIEPYACSMHAVERADAKLDDIVVLSGAGTLGLGMVAALRRKNPKKIVVLDMKDDRLELARKFGADLVLNPGKVDVEKEIKEMTDGYGCDIYIEATGNPKSVEQGLSMIRKLGRFVEFSVFGDPVTVDWSIISDRKELDLLGSHLGPYCYPTVIDGITDGTLPTEGVVTHKLPLEEFEKGFELMKKGDQSLKIVLEP